MTVRTITFDDEQFARAVYDNLAAADNQDVPLEEYPGRILSVLEQIAAPEPPAQQPMQHGMAVRQLGIVGKAFDTPDARRAYTYSDQPDNVVAMRLGKIASISPVSGGDFIDYGLQLLQRLQDAGFGVFELDGIGKGESNAD